MNEKTHNAIRTVIISAVWFLLTNSYAGAQSDSGPVIIRKKIITQQEIVLPKPRSAHFTFKSADAPLYDPTGKVDPFESLFGDIPTRKGTGLKPVIDRRGRKTELEQFDLAQLRLTGIIRAQSGNRGLIQESAGKGYIVTVGTFIGGRGGRIAKILKDRIVVEQKMKDEKGNIVIEIRELKMANRNSL